MSNENGWIPWDEREDVWKYVVKRFEDEYDDNDNEIYTFFYLGNVPDEYVNEFKKLAQDDDEYESDCEILLFEQLDEQDKIKALKYFVQHKYDLDDTFWWDVRRKLEQQDKDYFEILNKKSIGSNSPVVPASVPADETSGGRTVIDEKLKYDIGVFMKENPNCSNRAIARKFNLGTGTISSNPELKAFIERCRQLNIQSMEDNPKFDNDPFSNGRGRKNE